MRKKMLTLASALALVLTLAGGAGLAGRARPAAAQMDALSVIEQALEVANAGDVDGFMALYADDGVFMDDACYALFGPAGCVGTGQIRAVMEVFIPDDFQWTTVLEVSGNAVTGRAEGSWGHWRRWMSSGSSSTRGGKSRTGRSCSVVWESTTPTRTA